MRKVIKQYRYYGVDKEKNYPAEINKDTLASGKIFKLNQPGSPFKSIIQLGIQTLPGTLFYLNGNADEIIVNSTGIYEITLKDSAEIVALEFNEDSLKAIDNYPAGLVIDIVYNAEEGDQ